MNKEKFEDLDKQFLDRAKNLEEENVEPLKASKDAIDKKQKVPEKNDFEREMDSLNLTKDDIIDMAVQIAENGYIEEEGSLLGGKVTFTMRSGKMEDTKEFVSIFENLNATKQTTVDYSFNINTVGLLVVKYNGEDTGDTVRDRAAFMEENIPMPVFKKILRDTQLFGRKADLISDEQASLFF